jgi:signal transduction histidine kinase/ActR/RegA family two-component response regulator
MAGIEPRSSRTAPELSARRYSGRKGIASTLAAHAAILVLIPLSALVAMRLVSLPPTHLTVIWIPAGIALIAILRGPGWSALPTIWLANWIVMATANHYPYWHLRPLGSLFCAVSVLGPALGAWFWRRWIRSSPFEDPWSFLTFTFGVALLPALCTGWIHIAIVIASGIRLAPIMTWRVYVLRSCMTTASDALGVFLVVPLVLAPWSGGLARTTRERVMAHAVNFVLSLAIALLGFRVAGLAIFLAIPAALGATIFCGPRGVTVLVLTILVCGMTSAGSGPFASPGYPDYVPLFKMTVFAFCLGIPGQFAGLALEQLRRHRMLLESEVEIRTSELAGAKEAAESADRAKSQFLATMSHEIRTPMNGVLGFARLLESGPLSAEQKEYVGAILTSGETLLALLNNILDVSKIEAGAVEIEQELLNLQDMVQDVVRLFGESARQKGLALSGGVEGSIPAGLVGDEVRIRQVLSNLVGNAVKFTERGGVAIRVFVEPAPPDRNNVPRCRIVASVADTGIGIAPEQMDRLFRPFSQADSSITRRFGGSGLGLVISRRLCELLGGSLTVESQPGRGSTFRASFLAEVIPEAVGEPPRSGLSEAPMSRKLAVLVADDNYLNRRLTSALLKRLGHEPDFVGDGRAALERAKAGRYDLILMDVQMPVMDGLDAARAIRAAEGAGGRPRVPIVAVTADASREARDQCLQAGMDECMTKPLDVATFQAYLRRLSAGRARGVR